MNRLKGKVAVITGGARGIGLATVRRFLEEGAEVAMWDLDPHDAAKTLRMDYPGCSLHDAVVDVREAEAVRRTADHLVNLTGRIDILVNNAGINVGHVPTVRLDDSAWTAVVETNLGGALNCVRAVVPHMAKHSWGRIVNVSSVLAEYGYPGHAPYVATKAGLAALTRCWAREFARNGITVNAVRPGYIRTAMNEKNPAAVVQQVSAMTPLGRLGEPEDVANAFLFFCSEEASFVTGAVLPVDGGLVV
jgi:3-oxoacyl-[acyl-carrier protein] reductase